MALHHHVPCLECHACRHHAYAQCPQYKRTGITAGFEPAGGGYAEYVRVLPFVLPGVVKIPARNSFAEAAMLEPVNTVLKAVRRLALLPGDTVLVAGQGPIGLMFTRLLQLEGMRVLATDLLPARLKLAKKFGAKWTRLVGSARCADSPRCRAVAAGRTPQRGVPTSLDAAVIAVPSDAAVQEALQSVRGGGQVLLFAHTKRLPPSASRLAPCAFPLDLSSVCVDEKDLLGSYSADFTLQAEVARLVFSRRLDVRPLLTHRFPLAETAAAVRLAANPRPDSLKVLVTVAAA
ncbi:MAG: zinc-binding dehydrogenase [Verrucomicrobia bacterium]|nr:zinc-binding dehydrogenase [Verrucomicrobiota bacterium]